MKTKILCQVNDINISHPLVNIELYMPNSSVQFTYLKIADSLYIYLLMFDMLYTWIMKVYNHHLLNIQNIQW